jgi:hypothetical protein
MHCYNQLVGGEMAEDRCTHQRKNALPFGRLVDVLAAASSQRSISMQLNVRCTAITIPRLAYCWLLLVIAGFTVPPAQAQTGTAGPTPQERLVPPASAAGKVYLEQVKPIVEQRCVVCHGCYDSPCQFNQGTPEGIDRGASKAKVYDGGRLSAIPTTRLLEDARSTAEWRQQDFYPMLNEFEQTPDNNLDNSVMYRMLSLKREHPLPAQPLLAKSFKLGLSRKQECPKPDEFDAFKKKFPLWGMPYALPGLSDEEFTTLEQWLQDGALMATAPEYDPLTAAKVVTWEGFLNGDSLKEQLMARYLYEHWFLAHLHFPELQSGDFFRVVRSATPPGEPIAYLPTRRPYEDPGVERVYYRLWRDHSTVLDKTHMPYALDRKRMNWLRELFLEPDYAVKVLPSYQPQVAANPFVAFSAIPPGNRWLFLLEEAQYTIMNFIKGPVCRGQTSLNVIRDHFWVVFENPKYSMEDEAVKFLNSQEANLRMPVEAGSDARAVSIRRAYARSQEAYLKAKSALMKKHFPNGENLTLDLVWNGDGDNQNAALTVFRHFDSASVVKGLVGPEPQTAWLIDYPILERIHYLLVAGFDVFGGVGHQLTTRLYMDFLRMEGEFNFLSLLPPETRLTERSRWYEGAGKRQQSYLFGSRAEFNQPSGIQYVTDDPKAELYSMLQDKLTPILNQSYELDPQKIPAPHLEPLLKIAAIKGRALSYLPEVVVLNVRSTDGRDYFYTLLHNTAHTNVSSVLKEEKRLKPDEDTISVVRGFIGSYPDAYWVVNEHALRVLVNRIVHLSSEDSYQSLIDRFGVRRTSPEFWSHSDKVLKAHHAANPLENGLLDYNRLENR